MRCERERNDRMVVVVCLATLFAEARERGCGSSGDASPRRLRTLRHEGGVDAAQPRSSRRLRCSCGEHQEQQQDVCAVVQRLDQRDAARASQCSATWGVVWCSGHARPNPLRLRVRASAGL